MSGEENSGHSYTEGMQWPSKRELPNYSEKMESENAALKAALTELTDFTESLVAMHAHAYAFADAEFEKMAAESKAAIERAKKLINKQPQSESDKTE